MAKTSKDKKPGNTPETHAETAQLLSEVSRNFNEAKNELEQRITHEEQGFNEYDNLYRSYIKKGKWPFNSRIFIPLAFSTIYGKGTRQITGKIKGKLNATQFGNELAARIGTELLSAQYDDHDDHFEEPLVSKWFRMDQNARKYGASFALVPWVKEEGFDGPGFTPLDNTKVFFPVGVSSISDCAYVDVERNVSLEKLLEIQAKTNTYDHLAVSELKKNREAQFSERYSSVNAGLRGLSDKRNGFRLITEYRAKKWITWCPDVGDPRIKDAPGLILKVRDNPYNHKKIPIIRLVYIPIDDDIYGVSELEPGRSQQKAMNALSSGFVEAVSTELYPIIKGHPTNVDWKTVQFKPKAAWLMQNPQTDVARLEGGVTFVQHFVEAYRLLKSSFAESMGETAADVSNMAALQADKTATEVRDTALLRSARDNMNKLFLAAAVRKMYMFWWSMDKQMLTDEKVISVAGKDAIEYFVNEGLSDYKLSEEGHEMIVKFMDENPGVPFDQAYEVLREGGILDQYAEPLFPVGEKKLPKLQLSRDGKSGFLTVGKNDTSGQYRFSVDLNTIGMPNDQQEIIAMNEYARGVMEAQKAGMLGDWRIKGKELFESIGEKMKIHNVDGLFEKVEAPTGGQPGMPPVAPGAPPMGMQPPVGMTPEGMPNEIPAPTA